MALFRKKKIKKELARKISRLNRTYPSIEEKLSKEEKVKFQEWLNSCINAYYDNKLETAQTLYNTMIRFLEENAERFGIDVKTIEEPLPKRSGLKEKFVRFFYSGGGSKSPTTQRNVEKKQEAENISEKIEIEEERKKEEEGRSAALAHEQSIKGSEREKWKKKLKDDADRIQKKIGKLQNRELAKYYQDRLRNIRSQYRLLSGARFDLDINAIKECEKTLESLEKDVDEVRELERGAAKEEEIRKIPFRGATGTEIKEVEEILSEIKEAKGEEEKGIIIAPRRHKGKIPTPKDWERLERMIETLEKDPNLTDKASLWLQSARSRIESSKYYLRKQADAVESMKYFKQAKKEIGKARKLIWKARVKERAKTEEGRVKHAINYAKGELDKEANKIKEDIDEQIKKRKDEIERIEEERKQEIKDYVKKYEELKKDAKRLERRIKRLYQPKGRFRRTADPRIMLALTQYRDYLTRMREYEKYEVQQERLINRIKEEINARLDEEERRLKEEFKERLMAVVPSIIDEACEKYKIKELRGYVETPVWAMANRLIASGFDEISKKIEELKDFTVKRFESPLRILAGIGRGVELVPSAAGGGIEGIISILLTTLLSPVMVGAVIICIMFVTLGSAISGIFSGWTFTFAFVFAALFVFIEFSRVWHEITREELRKISEKGE